MPTVNQALENLSKEDVERISEEYLMGWHDLLKYGFRVKGFNHKRAEFGLCALTKALSDEYRLQYVKSHYSSEEIAFMIEEYLLSHRVGDERWDGIEIFGCRFGREYARLFKQLLGNRVYRRIAEKCRVEKLKETQTDLYGGVGLGSEKSKMKASITALRNKKEFLMKAIDELQTRHCVLSFFANSSVFEVYAYAGLVQHFGIADVLIDYGVHPYDKRYPYPCDFYVKSLDLFIELNVHFTHGGHWFDENNKSDVLRKQHLFGNHNARSKKFLDTWCNRDIAKRHAAMNGNLNYLVFWDGTTHRQGNVVVPNLKDFYTWLNEFDCDTESFIRVHTENTY